MSVHSTNDSGAPLSVPPPLPIQAGTAKIAQPLGVGAYATFWRRAVALGIDLVLLAVLTLPVYKTAAKYEASVQADLLATIVFWLYFALQHSSSSQATTGKRAVGIKVTDLSGGRVGFGRATLREAARILSILPMNFGYAMTVLTQRRQSLHDLLAGTLVVTRDTSPEEITAGTILVRDRSWLSKAFAGLVAVSPFLYGIAIVIVGSQA